MGQDRPATIDRMSVLDRDRRAYFFHPSMGLGGAERLILQASAALRKVGWKTILVTSDYNPEKAFSEAAVETIHSVPTMVPATIYGRFKAVCTYARLRRAVSVFRREPRPDLVVLDLLPHLVPAIRAAMPRVPILVYCHFPDQLLSSANHSLCYGLYRHWFDQLENEGLVLADQVLVNSDFTRRAVLKTCPMLDPSRVNVTYPGVDVGDARLPAAVPEGRSAVLCLGRIHPSKNLRLALRAFAVADLADDVRLIVAGGLDSHDPACWAEAANLEQLAMKLGVSHRVDWVFNPSDGEVEALWSRARALLHPPLEEHFGIVLLESMKRGIPVVAVNGGGPKEIVVHRTTGFLAEPTPAALAAAMVETFCDLGLWQSLSEASQTRVVETFDLARFDRAIQSVAECLVAEK